MNLATILAVTAIAAMLFFAARYIYKEKKKGKACIGCPYADCCPRHGQGHGITPEAYAAICEMMEKKTTVE